MLKTYEKFLFLGILILLAFFARAAYPSPVPGPADLGTRVNAAGDTAIIALPTLGNDGAPPASPVPPATTLPDPSSVFIKKGSDAPPSIAAIASLVADPAAGTIFESVNADRRWPTASLTKLMTATVALDTVDMNAHIAITESMMSADPTEATLRVGNTYTASDLMHLLLMPSSNVAAEALASYAGRASFLTAMNSRAAMWGMKSTYFDDPSGISSANQSTAHDMFTLAEHILKEYPSVLTITNTPATVITELASGRKTSVKSINVFAGAADFIGGKTGHTDEAGGNLLSIFRYDGHPLVVVVLGTDERFGETQKLLSWFRANFQ